MRTAVVTGAGRGIGLEIARRLGAEGYAVLLTARDPDAGRAAAEQVGPSAWSTTLDVRDPEAHRAVAAQAAHRGPLSVWINNAGVLSTKKAWEHEPDEIRAMVETNVIGAISGSMAAIHAMGPQGGDIVNVASIAGLGPLPGLSVYAATKHAVMGFTTSLQGDLDSARRPIRVHALRPAAVATDMVADRAGDPEAAVLFSGKHLSPERVADEAIAMIGTRRIVQALPGWRGHAMQGAGLWPRMGLRTMAILRRAGERRQGT